jgi:hypothetical protein
MSRNGPAGQPGRAPLRRPEADDYAGGPAGWPTDPQQGYAPHGPPGPQHSQGYYFPQPAEGDRNYGYAAQPVSQPLPFDRLPPAPQPGAPQWDAQQQGDAGHYDLGSYLPTAGGYGQPEPGPFAQSADGPFRHQYAPGREHGYEGDGEYEALPDDEGEEPRRGRRGLVIAGALIGAIGLGGAMAYTYKTFIATPTRAPVVKVTDAGPTKVKPSLTGGKEFANTDKKLLNRLDEEASQRAGAAADDRASEDPNAPRRVRSIPISPPGQMAAAGGSSPTVPGITLDNMAPPAGLTSSAPGRVQIPSGPPPQVMSARSEQAAVAPPPVKIVTAPPAAAAGNGDAAPAPARRVAAVAPPAREPTPKAASSALVTASTSGYVAVLSSQKSRMDALKAFADLQQKYGDVLSSKTPDVQEANLGDKGIWYRAVVGPPVSRDAASGICSQLKAAGYAGCWVTAY